MTTSASPAFELEGDEIIISNPRGVQRHFKAHRANFKNLQESPCGFGETEALALWNLETEEAKALAVAENREMLSTRCCPLMTKACAGYARSMAPAGWDSICRNCRHWPQCHKANAVEEPPK